MDANLEDEVRGSDECGDNVDNNEKEVENNRIKGESDEGRKTFIYNPQVADHLKPSVRKEFKTMDEVRDFYNAYAKEAGFSIRSWATKKFEGSDEVKRKEFVCFKQDSGKSSQSCGSVLSRKMSLDKDHMYNEPNQVRAKGCGKRLKEGKERALGKAKNSRARRCHGCGKFGQSHDKRNCPIVAHRDSPNNEGATSSSSSEDDSHTIQGSEMPPQQQLD